VRLSGTFDSLGPEMQPNGEFRSAEEVLAWTCGSTGGCSVDFLNDTASGIGRGAGELKISYG